MDWNQFDEQIRNYAEGDRLIPIAVGDLLNEAESIWGDKYLQAVDYFPLRKRHTVENWKSVCGSVPAEVRPNNVRMSQMDAVRALPHETQKGLLTWAAENGFGREEIIERMETEGLRIPRTGDAEKFIDAAIGKLQKALPISEGKTRESVKTALSVLEDARR